MKWETGPRLYSRGKVAKIYFGIDQLFQALNRVHGKLNFLKIYLNQFSINILFKHKNLQIYFDNIFFMKYLFDKKFNFENIYFFDILSF